MLGYLHNSILVHLFPESFVNKSNLFSIDFVLLMQICHLMLMKTQGKPRKLTSMLQPAIREKVRKFPL